MARKKIGHVELRWTCPKCGVINMGSVRTCQSCGAPQPEDVKFELPERQELITDESVAAKAEAGADIHCPYCGTRNPANATTCSQCGGDISEGARRQAGQVLGAFQTGPVKQVTCPRCGSLNPDTATTCHQCGGSLKQEGVKDMEEVVSPPVQAPGRKLPSWMIVGLIAFTVIVCGALIFFAVLSGRSEEITATVQGVKWERSIPIEGLVPVEYQALSLIHI